MSSSSEDISHYKKQEIIGRFNVRASSATGFIRLIACDRLRQWESSLRAMM
jgi:hypothetical protein